jgi:beta-glucosidase/6-phospho-beta-glucosidase/beta-galactosidase
MMNPFRTFFMGGFECADHINRSGERINLLEETEHDMRVQEDYKALAELDILVVREGICWSSVETCPGHFDFSEVLYRMQAAEKYGIQQIWDLVHFGYPEDIFPTHPKFCERFVKLCETFATFYKTHSKQRLFVVPINEISFLAWHSGDVRGTVPFMVNCGWDIKYHLCQAAIAGIVALKEIDIDCRIVLVEPMVKVHADDNTDAEHLFNVNEHQFQAMDIIAGRICPELGGCEEFLDILGFNYYWNCQWDLAEGPLLWPEEEPRRIQLSTLLQGVYLRYKKPIFLSETGHFGSGRVCWLEEVTAQCLDAKHHGVEFLGICIYPVTDRPDWDALASYSECGIWDLDENKNRIPVPEVINAVRMLQRLHIETMENFEPLPK